LWARTDVLTYSILSRSARGLSHVPLTPGHDGKGDQEKHDPDGTDDVRHDGNQTGYVTGVRPDEANNRSHDEHGNHHSEPIENPSSGDDVEPTLLAAFRQSSATSGRFLPGDRSLKESEPVCAGVVT
jgi:hypothetical protein